ncbi:MAG: YdeI/OmpD-associated family protein [Flavobacterium sp.]|nr:YdeI/OmpD-associated family protein [Flavobacterium sp.]
MDKKSDKSKWDESIDALKSILAKTELVETTKWGVPTYTYEGKNLIGINAFKDYVGIWFFNGVFLKDAKKKLVDNATTAKSMRQWRFTSIEEIADSEKTILEYVHESIENQKSGLVVKPEKKQTVISEYFQSLLDTDAGFATAFAKLTPGKQREFTDYIDSAKREETKNARVEKIKPMVMEGIGLNDKYR